MKILVVDDEKGIRQVIKEYLTEENYLVEEAENGKDAVDMICNNNYDLLIIDIMMPKMDGFEVLSALPKEKQIPTIILSARTTEYDKLHGFNLGIDDYVVKPFSPKEVVARVKAITKRIKDKQIKFYKYKTLEINFTARTLKIDNDLINLTPKEFDILQFLIENRNMAISREQLLSKLWGYDFFGDDRTIDTHIKMLRHNLGKYRDLIVTIRSIGYKFNDEKE